MIDAVGKKAIDTAIELGLFEALGAVPYSSEELSEKLGLSCRGLRPLLSLLAALDLLSEKDGSYLDRAETTDFLKAWPKKRTSIPDAPDWERLAGAVRTGRPARPPIEGEDDAGDFFSGVVSTLFGFHLPIAKSYAAQLPESVERVLDLGAGSGVWSLALAKERPDVRVVAVDHRRVLDEMTAPFLLEHGVREQYELRPGSYHEVLLEPESYDLIYLGHVIHSEGWEASRSLLGRCYEALKPGGLLAVAEWIASEPRSDDYHSALFDLNMLMFTQHGLVFTAPEMEQLAAESGFAEPVWVDGPGKYPVLQVRRGT
jgi:ubiquinone/menaquinone biosynthesis C-methylase UbiE